MTKNRKPKRKLAMKMMSREEIEDKISPFSCFGWLKRYDARKKKLNKK